MIDQLLGYIAPHHCYGCGVSGTILCSNCEFYIIDDTFGACLSCGKIAGRHGICGKCQPAYDRAWCVSQRVDTLEALLNAYKFDRAKRAHASLASLLDGTVDQLPSDTIVVSVPTVRAHVRQRGYDHCALLARSFAKRRGLTFAQPLRRRGSARQRDANRTQRFAQAKRAYYVASQLDPTRPYLLIDDIVTTGATMHYGAQALRTAGARHVWAAAIARQPLD